MAQGMQDPWGITRLAHQIRLNRQEERERPGRELRNQFLEGQVQQQQLNLAGFAKQQKDNDDFRAGFSANEGQDPLKFSIDFWKSRDPAKAQQFQKQATDRFDTEVKIDPVKAIERFNASTGGDFKFQGKQDAQGKIIQIKTQNKVVLYDTVNREIVKEFDAPLKSGETIESLPGGGFKITRGGGSKKRFSETQSKSGGFADRVSNVLPIFDELEALEGFDPAAVGETVAGSIPGVGNLLISPEKQRYNQAKLDFVTAVLRLESGAAISATEFEKEDKKYFPQPGDGPGVKMQKKKARERQLDILTAGSAGAFEEIQNQRKARTAKSETDQSQKKRTKF
jgi:hypothetical protein